MRAFEKSEKKKRVFFSKASFGKISEKKRTKLRDFSDFLRKSDLYSHIESQRVIYGHIYAKHRDLAQHQEKYTSEIKGEKDFSASPSPKSELSELRAQGPI